MSNQAISPTEVVRPSATAATPGARPAHRVFDLGGSIHVDPRRRSGRARWPAGFIAMVEGGVAGLVLHTCAVLCQIPVQCLPARATSPIAGRSSVGYRLPAAGGQRTNRRPSRSRTWPRRNGRARVSSRYAASNPGTFAKAPCGPRSICPVRTSYADWCHGQTRRPSSSMVPLARSAPRCRHRRETANSSPAMLPTAYRPAPTTAPGGRSATGHISCSGLMPSSSTLFRRDDGLINRTARRSATQEWRVRRTHRRTGRASMR